MAQTRICLIHWKPAEAKEKIERLRAAGYQVAYEPFGQQTLKAITDKPPAAVLIDLSRLPSQGRDVGIALRQRKATRGVPLVFVGGDPDKLTRIKKLLPDATFTPWGRVRAALRRALSHPPSDPVVPESAMAGYSGTPLVKKLGIKSEARVALITAPRGFETVLGDLPSGAKLRRGARGSSDLIIWFSRSRRDLERRIKRVAQLVGKDGLWIAWPKKASGIDSDLTQADVREVGLKAGLVDYKICAIDATWSGLKFSRRRKK